MSKSTKDVVYSDVCKGCTAASIFDSCIGELFKAQSLVIKNIDSVICCNFDEGEEYDECSVSALKSLSHDVSRHFSELAESLASRFQDVTDLFHDNETAANEEKKSVA